MEGGLRSPQRHPLDFTDPDFADEAKLDAEMRRVFDICHGCRRCFNLCDSFPRLFDLVDDSESGELDTVDSAGFARVVDACTLCDMCFMVSCPYVPPHEFDLDFPHLMLRYRSVQLAKGEIAIADRELAKTDRNGKLAGWVAPLANIASATGNFLTRWLLQWVAGVHRKADLPKFYFRTFLRRAGARPPAIDDGAPAAGRKAVIYGTCFVNYNNPNIGMAARAVLAENGVETRVVYPGCCGMPQLEHADFASVTDKARQVARAMVPWIDQGYAIVAPVPSCGLMLKKEWPLLLPDDPDIKRLAEHTVDICEYVVDIADGEGLAAGLKPLDGGVTVHLACHARAQNIGPKAVELLRLIPDCKPTVIERCSGHGGSWGVKKDFFEVAIKVGRPAARQALKSRHRYLLSECPLAGQHLIQGMERLSTERLTVNRAHHPIELFAKAYGLDD